MPCPPHHYIGTGEIKSNGRKSGHGARNFEKFVCERGAEWWGAMELDGRTSWQTMERDRQYDREMNEATQIG